MGFFIISRLLLMTLLLRMTTQNGELKIHTTLEPDNSARYQEFCLRISDDSHWISSKPVTQPPIKSSSLEPKTLKQPTQPNMKSTPQPNTHAVSSDSHSTSMLTHQTPAYPSTARHPESTTPNNQEEVTTEEIKDRAGPLEMVSNSCRCGKIETSPGPEASELENLLIQNPTATCRQREFIRTMKGGRRVCVPRRTAWIYINMKLKPLATSSTGTHGLTDTRYRPGCVTCPDPETLDSFDPDHVKSVWMMQTSLRCPCMVHVTMTEGNICVDSSQSEFRTLLEKLEI